MWHGRLVSQMMLSGPIVLLGAIAINGRAGAPPDDRPAFGPTGQQRLLQYVKPVRDTRVLLSLPPKEISGRLSTVVAEWLDPYHAGTLMPVSPVDFDTPSQDTVLGQIQDAQTRIVYEVNALAADYRDKRDYSNEALLLAQSIELSSICKYTEFATVHKGAYSQIRSLRELVRIAPNLEPTIRRQVANELSFVRKKEGRLEAVLQHVRGLHTTSLARHGETATTIEISQSYGLLAEAIESRKPTMFKEVRESKLIEDNSEMATVCSIAKLATTSEAEYHQAMTAALAEFQSPK